MEKEEFFGFLLKKKKSERTIHSYVAGVQQFERYLTEHKRGKQLEQANLTDLHDFERWGDRHGIQMNRALWGIKEYGDYISNALLKLEANAMLGERYLTRFKLKDFTGVSPVAVKELARVGVTTAQQMLSAGLNRQMRKELARRAKVPLDDVVELVKLSDQARIGGHKKVRARLYHDAGLDTIDKMAACEAEEIREILAGYIEKTGFKGVVPTPGEARNTVEMARYLKRKVLY